MTISNAKYPAWGVLTRAPAAVVRRLLRPLREYYDLRNFVYRTSGEWTAVFNMEPWDTGDTAAADLLVADGHETLAFDFSKYGYSTARWNGRLWTWDEDEDPMAVCRRLGIEVPGHEPVVLDPRDVIKTRRAVIVEGRPVAEVRARIPDEAVRIESGSVGAMVFDAPVNPLFDMIEQTNAQVFYVTFHPASGFFRVEILRGEDCLGTFQPGATRTLDGTPLLDNVLGATTAPEIVAVLGLPASFLDPPRTQGTPPRWRPRARQRMTLSAAMFPAWGVLTRAPAAVVRQLLRPLRERYDLRNFIYRSSGEWTAVFNMEPSPTSDRKAADRLRSTGHETLAFDFSKYGYSTARWDGRFWVPDEDEDPVAVCERVGIEVPGHEPVVLDPRKATQVRVAAIVEGRPVAEVRALIPDEAIAIDPGPVGAVVLDPPVKALFDMIDHVGARVFVVDFEPAPGWFRVQILRGEDCLGTFQPGATRTWDGTPFLDNVLGATTAPEVVAVLGLPASFLDPPRAQGTPP